MAYTKIHPIHKTLDKAIGYLNDKEKTEDGSLVDSFMCEPNTAHLSFHHYRDEHQTRSKVPRSAFDSIVHVSRDYSKTARVRKRIS